MNTITLNGVSSSTIQGLLIQELPPISKPKIRTQTEDIDGRDGDIVTRLGYSAYDKEIKIGLTYGYDVDDVIAFFDSQGIVTFSNEPDKYYNYQINEQIDFERLIRFKQAKVKFHVQPFKYKVNEPVISVTGNPVTEITAVNEGNIFAKPTLYLEGSGTVGVSVNGEEALSIDMSEIPHITIDVPEMNAYYDTELANRKVTGDPDDLFLDIGTDTISFTGNVTKAELTEYSRWI